MRHLRFVTGFLFLELRGNAAVGGDAHLLFFLRRLLRSHSFYRRNECDVLSHCHLFVHLAFYPTVCVLSLRDRVGKFLCCLFLF